MQLGAGASSVRKTHKCWPISLEATVLSREAEVAGRSCHHHSPQSYGDRGNIREVVPRTKQYIGLHAPTTQYVFYYASLDWWPYHIALDGLAVGSWRGHRPVFGRSLLSQASRPKCCCLVLPLLSEVSRAEPAAPPVSGLSHCEACRCLFRSCKILQMPAAAPSLRLLYYQIPGFSSGL